MCFTKNVRRRVVSQRCLLIYKHTFVESIIVYHATLYLASILMPHLTCVVYAVYIMTIYLPKFLYYTQVNKLFVLIAGFRSLFVRKRLYKYLSRIECNEWNISAGNNNIYSQSRFRLDLVFNVNRNGVFVSTSQYL